MEGKKVFGILGITMFVLLLGVIMVSSTTGLCYILFRSETTAATTLMANSLLIVTQVD